jgi:hypothetical protein
VQRHRAALPLVRDLDLEAEKVAKLPFQDLEIRVHGLGRIPGAGATNIGTGAGAGFFTTGASFGLTD